MKKALFLLIVCIFAIASACTKAPSSKRTKIGFSMDTVKEERWQRDHDAFDAHCKALNVECVITVADNKADKQANDVDNLLTQGVDVLVIAPHDATQAASMVEKAKAQGVPVLEGWGLTETSPCVTMTPPGTERVHSYVGKPIPGCEIMTTEEGEILAKGPNIMKGYFKDPQRTAEAIDHYGWLHTGDLGEITDYGLRMICRVDGMFKLSNGEKVSSMEIENILTLSSKWIAQAVTLGAGEHFVAALIFPNFKALENWAGKQGRSLPEGMDLALDKDVRELISNEILDNISDVQPKYQRVKAFVIIPKELTIEENELTPTMKVVRHFVLEKYHDLVGAIYRPSKHPDKLAYVVRLPGGNHAVSKKVS